jgi:hypothetical protein
MTNDTIPALPALPSAPADPSDVGSIARARALLASLEITTWSGRRLDKQATRDTTSRAGAEDDAGRFNKLLLGGKVPSFAAVQAAAGAARAAHYAQTLPWTDGGQRLLPVANYFEYAQTVRDARATFRAAVDAFLAEYPALVDDAARRLGTLYDPSDYPTVEELSRKFAYRVGFFPLPAATDIRVDLPPEVIGHMQRSVTARVGRAVETAVRDGWARMAETVERIRDRVQEVSETDGGRLHAALFDNARETAETLRRLNVLEDPQLDAMAERIISELGTLDPKALRKDPTAMQDTAARADAILASMAGIYGGGA